MLFLALLAAYSYVLLSAPTPPLFVDYPDWVYQGFLFHGTLTGHSIPGYVLKHYPVPNSTTTVLLGLLDCVLPWARAAKLFPVLYLLLASVATGTLVQVLRVRDPRLLIALPAIVFLNLDFWYGHISFELGLCLLLLLLAMLIRRWALPWIAAMLVLIFFTHMEACAAALLLLLVWCAVTRDWHRFRAAIPALLLTVWYAVGRISSGDSDVRGLPTADARYGSLAFFVYKFNTFTKVFGYVNVSASPGASQSEPLLGRMLFALLLLLSLLLAALALVAIFRAATGLTAPPVALREPPPDAAVRTISAFALLLVALCAVLPQQVLGVSDPGSRLLLVAAALGLFIVDWRSRAGNALALLSLLFGAVNLFQMRAVDRNPSFHAETQGLPAAMLRYAHVEPATRLVYYKHLEDGALTLPVFPTGLYSEAATHWH